jgi:hypothetical protein
MRLFEGYVLMGAVNVRCILLLSGRTEVRPTETQEDAEVDEVLVSDRARADDDLDEQLHDIQVVSTSDVVKSSTSTSKSPSKSSSSLTSRFAHISPSARLVIRPFFIIDSLIECMASDSLTTYYLSAQFDLSSSNLGDIMLISYFASAASTIFACPLADRLTRIGQYNGFHSFTFLGCFPTHAKPRGAYCAILHKNGSK